jgi:type I restriction enzyme, S subunit
LTSELRQHRNAPKLRFPEFQGPWKPGTINQFLNRVVNPVDVDPKELYRQIGVRSHGKGVFHKEPVSGFELGEKRVFWVEPNTLVINIVFAWEQALAITTENEKGFIASHRFPMFAAIQEKTHLPFIFHFFLRKRGKSLLSLASPGGAGRNKTLGQNEFAKLKVVLPELSEQKKNAAFLSLLDQKIAKLKLKKKLLEDYNRGFMHKILNQKLRFTKADRSYSDKFLTMYNQRNSLWRARTTVVNI